MPNNRAESDEWRTGSHVLDPARLAEFRAALEETPLIVEHRFYRGGRAPERRVFEGFDELHAYLRAEARPGDAIWAWRYDASCRDDNALAHGKVPDAEGTAPTRGAY